MLLYVMSASANPVVISDVGVVIPNAQMCADSASLTCLNVCCCTMNNEHMETQTHRT